MTNDTELAVELTESYAHRVGDGVHLVVQLTGDVSSLGHDTLALRKGKRVVSAHVAPVPTATGTMVEATVPAQELGPGTWRLSLTTDPTARSGPSVPLEARLVYNDKQPVALLPGPLPTTTLAPPRPGSRRGPAPAPARARLYRAAAKVVDTGLRALPDERAARYREALKKTGRRVLG